MRGDPGWHLINIRLNRLHKNRGRYFLIITYYITPGSLVYTTYSGVQRRPEGEAEKGIK